MSNQNIMLEISNNEALVLFEWLYNFNQQQTTKQVSDEATAQTLYNLEALLETKLDSLFSQNYSELLRQAKLEILGSS